MVSQWIKDKTVSLGRFMWKGSPEEAKKPAPHWFHFGLQICVGAYALYWHWNLPAPNKAVLALASVAALMVLAEMRPIHKTIYVFLIVALVSTETHAIDNDRALFAQDETHKRKEENKNFQTIADGIKNTIKENQSHFDATMAGLKDTVNTETGGNSFCYLDLYPGVNDVATMNVLRVGKYPLRGISMRIQDRARVQSAVDSLVKSHQPSPDEVFRTMDATVVTLSVPDFATHARYVGGYQLSRNEQQSFDILFHAFNGEWIERLEMRKVREKWVEAIMVEGVLPHKFFKIDPTYPRIDGKLDVPNWPRPVKGKPEWEH